MKTSFETLKKLFGSQLKAYRQSIGLIQQEFGELHNLDQSFVNKLEQGQNLTMESMQRYADTYGVTYYHLANPELPIPPLSKMPNRTKKQVEKIIKQREKLAAENDAKKEAGEKVYLTGSAKLLHTLISEGFFKKARTSREAFLKLNSGINDSDLSENHTKEVHKMTATLSQGKFARLLNKLPPVEGGTAVRFIEKSAG